ncbi:MAG TPA: hypothetical protein VFF50_07740 [Candidatus Deferrimicrobiaceae bacterium]|nr:hypothetical protein [Candidatus Deferrimicrobiaceae bacterium]
MKAIRLFCMAVALVGTFSAVSLQAQEPASPGEPSREATLTSGLADASRVTDASLTDVVRDDVAQNDLAQNQNPPRTTDGKSSLPDSPSAGVGPSTPTNPSDQVGKQPKRILGIIPNYRAVSAYTHLPPLNFKGELWLATQDTFDYSNFIFTGVLAGIDMAGNSQPAFGQGAEGFGKYYWHVFVDGGIENYMTEAIVPAATKEDPRYYTLFKGGFVKRTSYAVTRLFITRTNSGGSTFNLSEVVGAGAAAGIGNAYYPAESNPWVKTYQRWGTQVGLDGVFNVLKEFWPDIDQKIFRGKY